MLAIGIRSSGDESSRLDAALSFDGIEANEVEREVLEDGEVMGGVSGPGAHLIVGESHIHAPMQAVLDRPMGANGGE